MTGPESLRPNKYPPVPERNSSWYQRLFEERLAKLSPYDKSMLRQEQRRFGLDAYQIEPYKLTYAILTEVLNKEGKTFEIIVDEETESGYQNKHREMLSDLGLDYEETSYFRQVNGVVIQATDYKIFLIMPDLFRCWLSEQSIDYPKPNVADKIIETLKRYKIAAIFCENFKDYISGFPYVALPEWKDSIIVDPNIKKAYEAVSRETLYYQQAQKNNFTLLEYLRYHQTGEWPEEK